MIETNATNNRIDDGSATRIDNIWDGGGTITWWMQVSSFAAGYGYIYAKGAWSILHPNSGRIGIEMFFGANYCYWECTNVEMTDGTLHHCALSFDSGSASNTPTMYVDGASVAVSKTAGTGTGTRNDDAANVIRLGCNGSGSTPMRGKFGDVRAYDRILGASEVLAIARSRGRDNIRLNLQARWLMMEGAPGVTVSGSGVVRDTCGASDGTPNNTPSWRGQIGLHTGA